MSQFIIPVAMKVTQEQYEKDLKKPLKKLGYLCSDNIYLSDNFPYLVTNYGNSNKCDNYHNKLGTWDETNNRQLIYDYVPELFLAIAAMTKGEDWSKGEYLIKKTNNLIFKVTHLIGCDSILGHIENSNLNKELYRKATVDELVNYFSDDIYAHSKNKVDSQINKENLLKKDGCNFYIKIDNNWTENQYNNIIKNIEKKYKYFKRLNWLSKDFSTIKKYGKYILFNFFNDECNYKYLTYTFDNNTQCIKKEYPISMFLDPEFRNKDIPKSNILTPIEELSDIINEFKITNTVSKNSSVKIIELYTSKKKKDVMPIKKSIFLTIKKIKTINY